MIGRIFWFAVGAGSAVYTAIKVQELARQATPKAIGQRVSGSVASLGEEFRSFTERARAAMAEREAELRAELDQPRMDQRALDQPPLDQRRARSHATGRQD